MQGFTMVELVMVIVILGIVGVSLTYFFVPMVTTYIDSRRRADLTDMADTALRRMATDIRSAVPNSVSVVPVANSCFKLVPTSTGGRYRMAADTENDSPGCAPSANCSAPLDVTKATTTFDVLSDLKPVPATGDWVVIGNQNTADVYSATPTYAIKAQVSSTPTNPRPTDGTWRLTVNSTQFPPGYDGGRFFVVPNASQTVFFSCVDTGNSSKTLYRTTAAFTAPDTTCAATTGDKVATDVKSCSFVYDSNQGATQQSGFVWMRLELQRSGNQESVVLSYGVHVDNVP
jgi:MSHA biogenesis protein MshO